MQFQFISVTRTKARSCSVISRPSPLPSSHLFPSVRQDADAVSVHQHTSASSIRLRRAPTHFISRPSPLPSSHLFPSVRQDADAAAGAANMRQHGAELPSQGVHRCITRPSIRLRGVNSHLASLYSPPCLLYRSSSRRRCNCRRGKDAPTLVRAYRTWGPSRSPGRRSGLNIRLRNVPTHFMSHPSHLAFFSSVRQDADATAGAATMRQHGTEPTCHGAPRGRQGDDQD